MLMVGPKLTSPAIANGWYRCPFCFKQLERYAEVPETVFHPMGHCLLSGQGVGLADQEKWNTRHAHQ